MPNWLTEFLYVLSMSKRTQYAILLGLAFFVGTLLLGEVLVARLEFQGSLRGLEAVVGEAVLRRYDKVAIFCLLSSWGLAIKFYIKDRKRFW